MNAQIQLKQKYTLFCLLCLFYASKLIFAYDFGCYVNPEVYWDTPGHHYVPDGRMPIHHSMTVFSTQDIIVMPGTVAARNWENTYNLIPTKWTVEKVTSNINGNLAVTGDPMEWFPLNGTQGEKLTIYFLVVPEEGYTWPKAYLLKGIVSSRLESEPQVGLAIGAWYRIQDPHRSFSTRTRITRAGDVVGCYGNQLPDPVWSPPYGKEKNYSESHYAPWVDKGDIIMIKVPDGYTSNGWMRWHQLGMSEGWSNIPPEGIGSTHFYTRGGTNENTKPKWIYPDDYIPTQQYSDYQASGYPYPYPCIVRHSSYGLSFGSVCAEIYTPDKQRYLLDDGIDESGVGLYGPGFVGQSFVGPAPASGFLKVYINMGDSIGTFGNDVDVNISIIDIDNDDIVDFSDLVYLCDTWLSVDTGVIAGYTDFNNDGIVNISDFTSLAAKWYSSYELPIAGKVVFVEEGAFPYQYDTANEQSVNVPSFYINKYEVTNEQYCQFLNETDPCGIHYYFEQAEIIRTGTEGFYTYKVQSGKEKYPVRNVNFNDALAYTQWVSDITGQSWRLPTEIEWEKAAAWNPGTQQYNLYGCQRDAIDCNWSNIVGCMGEATEVGYYDGTGGRNNAVSFYGCYDMTGNLLEFTTKPGTGECVIRGGSWGNDANLAKNNYRWEYDPANYSWYIGLRLVRE